MNPVKIQIKGFLSYQDRATVDFTKIDLACVTGSNGAGKSSLLDAMTWALFGQARKRDDSVINNFSDFAEVEFEFEYEGNTYRILRAKYRDKPTVLELHIKAGKNWKPLTEKSVRDTEERIRNTLRMDYDVFTNASFFLQGKADQFAQQRPGDRKRILGSILGLEVWEGYRASAVERRKSIEERLTLLDGGMAEVQIELNESEERKKRLADLSSQLEDIAKIKTTQTQLVDALRKDMDKLEEYKKNSANLQAGINTVNTILQNLNKQITERETERQSCSKILDQADEIANRYSRLMKDQEKLRKLDTLAKKFSSQDATRQALSAEIASEQARLCQEYNSLIPQMEEVAKAKIELQTFETRAMEVAGVIQGIHDEIKIAEDVQQQLTDAINREAEAKAENPRLRKEMDELKARIEQLKDTNDADCPVCHQSMDESTRKTLLKNLETEGKQKGDRFRENQTYLAEAGALVADLNKKVRDIESKKSLLGAQERQQAQIVTKIQTLQEVIESWNTNHATRLAELQKIEAELAYAPEAQSKLNEIVTEMSALGYDPDAHDALRQQIELASDVPGKFTELEKAKATAASLDRELIGLQDQVKLTETNKAQQEQSLQEMTKKLDEVQKGSQAYNEAVASQQEIQNRENALRMEIGAASQKVEVLKSLQKRKETMTTEREMICREIEDVKTLERAFSKNGVPALLIEQALPEIENKANAVLNQLSNGNMTVRFVTQAAYKDDKREDMKETLDIQISDPAGTRDYEMFSGGESFRVNFAVRLALAEVLAQRAGAKLQMLVIDEGFGSQDTQGRQKLLEAINLVKKDFAKILVITHIEELKEAFPHQIEVTKSPTGTQLSVR